MKDKELYIDFDEYIRQGEPAQRERAEAWSIAIGLQAVDGLKVSEYLKETARKNIEGDITIDEARKLVKTYYQSKNSTNLTMTISGKQTWCLAISQRFSLPTHWTSAQKDTFLCIVESLKVSSSMPDAYATTTSPRKNGCLNTIPFTT